MRRNVILWETGPGAKYAILNAPMQLRPEPIEKPTPEPIRDPILDPILDPIRQSIPEPPSQTGHPLSNAEQEHVLGPLGPSGAPAPPLTRHRRPLPALTGLRFFAAAYVVSYHTRLAAILLLAHPFLSRFFSNGYLAVALFFLLSGFILSYTYRGQVRGPRSARRFWEARFARLWPAYVLSLLCSSLPGMWFPPLPAALLTLFMVQAWNPWHPELSGSWNFVCWTLSVEAFFYLSFPWLQRAAERLRPRVLALVGLAWLCVGVLGNVSARTLGDQAYAAPWNRIPLPVIHLPEFLIGMVLGNLFLLREQKEKPPSPVRGNVGLVTSFGLLASLALLCTVHGAASSLVLPVFALLIAGLAAERSWLGSALSSAPLLLGGAISYSMYLLQTPVRIWVHLLPLPAAGDVAGLIFVPLALLPAAYLAYRGVEEPSRRVLRRAFTAMGRGQGASS